MKQTGDVEVCRSPRWTCSKFRFNVGPQHHYLNLCVYDRLRSEERGELLIGHVSLTHTSPTHPLPLLSSR